MTKVDLEALDALLAAWTPTHFDGQHIVVNVRDPQPGCYHTERWTVAELIVKLRRLRKVEAARVHLRRALDALRAYDEYMPEPHAPDPTNIPNCRAARVHLRRALDALGGDDE